MHWTSLLLQGIFVILEWLPHATQHPHEGYTPADTSFHLHTDLLHNPLIPAHEMWMTIDTPPLLLNNLSS